MIRFATRSVRCATLTGMALSLAGCGGPSGSELVEWQLVWQDEFEGPAGQPPDPAKWGYDIGTDWGNAQLEYDTDRPENAPSTATATSRSPPGGVVPRAELHVGTHQHPGAV